MVLHWRSIYILSVPTSLACDSAPHSFWQPEAPRTVRIPGYHRVHLTKLSIAHYRAYQSAELSPGPTGLTVLTGPNNSGKSALLSALDVVAGLQVEGPLLHHQSKRAPVIEASFALLPELDLKLLDVPTGHAWNTTPPLLVYRWVRTSFEPDVMVLSTAALQAEGANQQIVATIDQRTQQLHRMYWTDVVERWPNLPTRQVAGVGSRTLETWAGQEPWLQLLMRWRLRYFHFKALRPGGPRVATTSASALLHSTGDNLAEHLLWVRSNKERRFRDIRSAMKALIPGIGSLQVRATGSTAEVGFDGIGGRFRNVKDMGTGVEQLLLTLTVGLAGSDSALVIEEPETNLHAGAQRALLRYFHNWSRHGPIVLASHSPIFLDLAPGDCVLSVRRQKGHSRVRPVRPDSALRTVLDELGVQLGDVLAAERVLIVEGKSDAAVLRRWFPALLRTDTVVVPAGGGVRASRVRDLRNILENADRLKRRYLAIRDRDELTDEQVASMEVSGDVKVLPRRELENYLLDGAALLSFLRSHTTAPQSLTPEGMERSMKELADTLRERVILDRALVRLGWLTPIYPVKYDELASAHRAASQAEAIAAAVTEKLCLDVGDVRQQLYNALELSRLGVTKDWETQWRLIVPGADLLL